MREDECTVTVSTTTQAHELPEVASAVALTLRAPWAAAVTYLGKNIENRVWAKRRPGPVLIHAGVGQDRVGWEKFAAGFPEILPNPWPLTVEGAFVAVTTVDSVCGNRRYGDGGPCECGPWAMPGQFHFRLGKVWPLREPVPCPGSPRQWRPQPDIIAAVEQALRDSVDALTLTCNGRDRGQPTARPCGRTHAAAAGENITMFEARARSAGWRLGPAGPTRHVMCPRCAQPPAWAAL